MNRITGIKIDKRLADNLPDNYNLSDIPGSQLIEVTVTVVNEKDIPQSGIPVNWSVSNTPAGMIALDANKQSISGNLENTPAQTDSNGNAIIYIGAKFKSIFNIGAYLNSQNKKEIEETIKEYQQTLVICTFDDEQGGGGDLPAPQITTTGNDGSVQIPESSMEYGISAKINPVWYTSGNFAAWFKGKVNGYAGDDNEIGEKLIITGEYDPQQPVTYQIPYQWMIADGSDQNQSAVLFYSNSGTLTRMLSFAASGEAMAIPDFDGGASSAYQSLVYAYSDIDNHTLGKKDLLNHNGAFDFIIPDYENRSETDKIEVNVYINAWDELGLERKCRQVVTKATLGDFNHGSNYIYSLPGSVFNGYGNEITNKLGLMFLRYKINDRDAFLSEISEYQLNFPPSL